MRTLKIRHRHLIVSGKHKRLQRLWQFFFTGWGLVMMAALAAAPFFTKNLIWTPISSIDVKAVARNQFKMENASFAGTDKNGEPFMIRADYARQEYADQDKIFLTGVRAKTVRIMKDAKITDTIAAAHGVYEKSVKKITLTGNIRVDSSNGDKIRTEEMVIQL
jgi:LPS export ABC transporter protein LptC